MNHKFHVKQMIIWLKPAATKQNNPKLEEKDNLRSVILRLVQGYLTGTQQEPARTQQAEFEQKVWNDQC